MANNLDSHIAQIVARAAAEIAQTVRANIAAEVNRLVGTAGSSSPRKAAAPVAASPAAAPKATSNGVSKKRRRRGIDAADLEKVTALIARKPGLRSEQIQKESGLDKPLVAKVLTKLRFEKKVKTKGERRAMTYHAG